MKIAVFSDTHRHTSGAVRVILRETPDLVIHLGDHIRDADALAEQFPDVPLERVPGNCDYAPTEPEMKCITAAGVTLMLTHGHPYRVKYGLDALLNAAYFQGADMVLFGHTHRPLNDCIQGLYVVNPGTAGCGHPSTWACIQLENGQVQEVSIRDIPED